MDKKVCSKCGEEKPIEEFHYIKSSKKYRNSCKICFNESKRDPKLRLEYERKLELRLKKKEESKKQKENDKKKQKNKSSLKWKRRWDNDELFRIKVRLRNLVRNSFRRQGYSKNSKTYEILGVEFDEFKLYFESKFTEGMTWDNMGEWHIDHIIPISSAKDENEMVKLNHYTNLQPLWEIDNLMKSNKIIL